MDKKTGFVAFFDILGYRNFLKRNKPEIAAEKITEFLKKLKAFQSETYLSLFEKEFQSEAKPIVEKIVYLVISDSILLTLEADKSVEGDYKFSQFLFLVYCARLSKDLFIYGLPVRGAIEYGEYVLVENQTLVGTPIVDAYQSATDLDLSACQVSNSVEDLVASLENVVYLKYNTPLTTGEEKELVLLMPFSLADDEKDEFTLTKITDLEQFIMRSFSAHSKMVNKESQRKS